MFNESQIAGEGSRNFVVQAKLNINQPGDTCEQQADEMAKAITNNNVPAVSTFFSPVTNVQRMEGTDKTGDYINLLNSKGRPLTKSEKQFFEPKFNQDFSSVRLHVDAEAALSAKSINARAYTSGNNIVFGNVQYNGENDDGKRLVAQELTHVVQQQGQQQAIQREGNWIQMNQKAALKK